MTTKKEHLDDMTERATYTLELDRRAEDDDGGTGDEVGAAVMITDPRGKSLAVEVGTGDRGVFASVRAFDGEDGVEPQVFVDTVSTMIVVE